MRLTKKYLNELTYQVSSMRNRDWIYWSKMHTEECYNITAQQKLCGSLRVYALWFNFSPFWLKPQKTVLRLSFSNSLLRIAVTNERIRLNNIAQPKFAMRMPS